MDCPKCKCHIDQEDARFCGNCGAPLQRETGSQDSKQSGQGGEYQARQSRKREVQKKQKKSSSQGMVLLTGGVIAALAVVGIVIFGIYFFNRKGADSDSRETTEETGILHDSDDSVDGNNNTEHGEDGNGKEDFTKEEASADTSETEVPVVSGWQQEGEKWYYYDGQGTMLTDTWVENYYVGTDGVMLTNVLTPDGYWLGEDGLADEDKRIYGDCLFAPQSYAIEGDKVLITGTLCDSVCAAREVMDSLQVGDLIIRPSDGFSGRVCEFDTESAITDITYYDYLEEDTGSTSQIKTVFVYTEGGIGFGGPYTCYSMNEREMYWDCDDSMPQPLYRIIQRDVVLVADRNVSFEAAGSEYVPASIMEYLEQYCQNGENRYSVLEIGLTGDRIDWIKDVAMNYAG